MLPLSRLQAIGKLDKVSSVRFEQLIRVNDVLSLNSWLERDTVAAQCRFEFVAALGKLLVSFGELVLVE